MNGVILIIAGLGVLILFILYCLYRDFRDFKFYADEPGLDEWIRIKLWKMETKKKE